jgi:hypothetical protein
MKIFFDSSEADLLKKSAKIDLPDLIRAAGHECLVKDGNLLSLVDNTPKIDRILALNQANLEQYRKFLSIINFNGVETLQSELKLLDKFYANSVLEQLGLNYLNTIAISSREDIVNFSDSIVLIKPKIGMQAKSTYRFTYIPMPKEELLTALDASDIDLSKQEYILQEGVTNGKPIMWFGGYVNPSGDIYVDGVLDQEFSINDEHFENKLRYPERHRMKIQEVKLDELNEFHLESIRQIKIVLKHIKAKATPFCIQTIIDDDNEVQILDFNFSFGKGYMLRIREKTPEYIIDRIKYTYGGADSIPPNATYMMNIEIDTPNGFTDEMKEYIKDKPILLGFGNSDKDYVNHTKDGLVYVYHRHKSYCVVIGDSKPHCLELIENFKTFLSTLT